MSNETFYVVIAICVAILTGFLIWASVRLVKTLNNADKILKEVNGVISELEIFKSGLKMGLVTLISALVAKLRLPAEKTKGGEAE